MVRDQEHDKTLECIQHQYQENEEDGQSAPNHGRGYVHHADHYFTQRLLKKQPERRLGGCPADARDHHSQSREQGHEGWHMQPSRDRPQGLYAHHETPERAPQGHPLGGVIPKEYHRNSMTHSIRPERTSLIWRRAPRVRQRWKSGMTLSHRTLRHPDIPWWLTESTI